MPTSSDPSSRPPARGPRPTWSRERAAAAGVGLADLGGLAAASLRAVAAELGAAPASLYRYVASREQLIGLMVDTVLAELPETGPGGGGPVEDLLVVAGHQLALHRRHPWLLEAALLPLPLGSHGLAWFDRCLGLLAPLPCSTTARTEALAMMTGVVQLFARDAVAGRERGPSLLAGVDPSAHPHLAAALADPGPPSRRDDLLDRTLRGVLSALLDPGR